jgi:uncharacterized RmlC-like cupin family protein
MAGAALKQAAGKKGGAKQVAAPMKSTAPKKAAPKQAAAGKAAAPKKAAAPMKAAAPRKGAAGQAAPPKRVARRAAAPPKVAAKTVAVKKAAARRPATRIAVPTPAARRARAAAAPRKAPAAARKAAASATPSPEPRVAAPQVFTVSHLDQADFKTDGLRSYAQYRDLGIAAATGGLCQAHVIRFTPPCTDEVRKRHAHQTDLQLIYVLQGWMKNEFEGHGEQMMSAGSCWLQPSGIKHTVLDYSADCEVLEIIVPADFKTAELI